MTLSKYLARLGEHKKLLTGLWIVLLATTFVAGQEKPRGRDLTSLGFVNQRPDPYKSLTTSQKGNTPRKGKTPNPRPSIYKFIREDKGLVRRKKATSQKDKIKLPLSVGSKTVLLGVTVWRLREPKKNESGPSFFVRRLNGEYSSLVPERVSTGTTFQRGDLVKLTFESSVSGYLYVINSELHSNGKIGNPILIFPRPVNLNNKVEPGMLVEIPDQSEAPSFFINPKHPEYSGELLTVIVSPKPINGWEIDGNGRIKNVEKLEELEATGESELFETADGIGKVYSETELQAVCGSRFRDQKGESGQTQNPCRNRSRELSPLQPPPQSIYRVKTASDKPAVVFVKLNVRL
jgi:hypothetical protein